MKTYLLDDDAQDLYRQLEGLEDPRKYLKRYLDEQEQLNDWRKSMVEFVYLLAHTLNNYRLSEIDAKNMDDVGPIMKVMNRLAEIPQREREKKVVIRHRGLGLNERLSDSGEETKFDYVVSCGDCVIDKPFMEYLIKMKIIDDPSLLQKLDTAFRFFYLSGIYIVEIRLSQWGMKEKEMVNTCFVFWARYFNEFSKGSKNLIFNESNKPDPNLTILARLNRVKRESFQGLIHEIQKHYMN